MSVPVDMADTEERALEKAEELAQVWFGEEFNSLSPQQQVWLWQEAFQDVVERRNEAAELAWEEHLLRESMEKDEAEQEVRA